MVKILYIDNVYEDIKNKGKITVYTSSDEYGIELLNNNLYNPNIIY